MVNKIEDIFKPEEGWLKVPDLDDMWCPTQIGDYVAGVYINKEENVGRNHATMYTLKDSKGIENKIFGTVGLNKKMLDIPIGSEVGIMYNGEKPSTPPKKPYKLFDVVHREIGSTDTIEGEGTENTSDDFLADEQAVRWIDTITDDLIEEGVEPTEKKILVKAKDYHIEKVEGLTPDMLGRIDKELKRKG
jgi:hypothetical protein